MRGALAPITRYRPLLLLLAAAWPVAGWYGSRALDGSDDPVELLALATAVGLFLYHGGERLSYREPGRWQYAGATVLLLLYTVCFEVFYPMVRAGVVVAALALLLGHTRASLSLGVLLFLSLPASATLAFYLGYPLRLVVAEASGGIVSALGWEVSCAGTTLHWAGETILVDAPCSGLKMLWAGCFFAAALAYWRLLPSGRAILLLILSGVLLISANIARATFLFFKESGILTLPEWTHAATGLVIFAGAALALLWLSGWLANEPLRESALINDP